jgi:hypothetical protein
LTGTAVIYGSGFNTRTITRPFTMIINGRTSPEDVTRQLRTLERGGQDDLLHQIDDYDLGRFSLGSGVGVPVNTIIVENNGDEIRIRAIFARWMGFGELRRGLRSTDYPFSYVDIRINPRTGKGDGTFIPAARIRSRGGDTIEVEDFGTFPGRLMGVRVRGSALR